MTAKQYQTLLTNVINEKVEFKVYPSIYTFTCKGNSESFFKEFIHNLNPNSFETMQAINITVGVFNFNSNS